MLTLEGVYMMSQTFEVIWVGKLGAVSLAGVGAASLIFMLVNSVSQGFITGARAMIARFMGVGDAGGANHVAGQAFVISTTFVLVVAPIGFFFAEPILSLFGLEADVVAEGTAYLHIIFAGWVVMSLWRMLFSIMEASGDTVTPMKIAVFFRCIHVAFFPFLILGWWVFPRLGVRGAALSNVVAEGLGMSIGLWVLFRGRTRLWLTFRDFRLDLNIIWRIVKIGIPASIIGMQGVFSNLVLMRLMVPFGTVAVAAHSLIVRVQQVLFLPGVGLGKGAGVLVGQNLGAGQPKRAERTSWLAVGVVEGFMVACSVAILLWAEYIIHIFSTEPGLVEVASIFLRIAVAGYLAQGFTAALQSAISGAGDTLPPMLVSLVMIWLVQIPLAFFLPRVTNLGVYGIRWAMVAGMVGVAVALTIYFQLGRWKRKKV